MSSSGTGSEFLVNASPQNPPVSVDAWNTAEVITFAQPAVAEIEVVPELGMTYDEAVRRGRLLSQRLGNAADVNVGD